jgi:hypothetical protein
LLDHHIEVGKVGTARKIRVRLTALFNYGLGRGAAYTSKGGQCGRKGVVSAILRRRFVWCAAYDVDGRTGPVSPIGKPRRAHT